MVFTPEIRNSLLDLLRRVGALRTGRHLERAARSLGMELFAAIRWEAALNSQAADLLAAIEARGALSSFLAALTCTSPEAVTIAVCRWCERFDQPLPDAPREPFARPAGYEAAEAALARGLVILVGPPGIGKTRVALELRDALLLSRPELAPGADIDAMLDEGVRLLDDWLGGSKSEADLDAHVRLLEEAANRRRARCHIVVTARTERLAEAFGGTPPAAIRRAVVSLGRESYSDDALWSLFAGSLPPDGPYWHWLPDARPTIMAEIEGPWACGLLAGALRAQPDTSRSDLAKVIDDARVRKVHEHVAALAQDRPGGTGAVDTLLIRMSCRQDSSGGSWAVDQSVLDELAVDLPDSEPYGLLDRLCAAERATIEDGGWRAHPEVIRGLDDVLDAARHLARLLAAVRRLAESRTTAEALCSLWDRLGDRAERLLPGSAVVRLNDELMEGVMHPLRSGRFDADAFWRLGRYGRSSSPVGLFARAFHDRTRRPGRWYRLGFGSPWVPPSWSQGQREEVARSDEARELSEAAIRAGAFCAEPFCGVEVPRFLNSLGWNLHTAFREALDNEYCIPVSPMLVFGASLSREVPLEPEFELLAAEEASLEERDRAIRDGEESVPGDWLCDEAYSLSGQWEALLAAARERGDGWEWIPNSPWRRWLVPAWARVLGSTSRLDVGACACRPDRAELDALWAHHELCDETVSYALVRWLPREEARRLLIAALLDRQRVDAIESTRNLLCGLLALDQDEEVCGELRRARRHLRLETRVALSLLLRDPPIVKFVDTKDRSDAYRVALGQVDGEAWLAKVLPRHWTWSELKPRPRRPPGAKAVVALRQLASGTDQRLAAAAMVVLSSTGIDVAACVPSRLTTSQRVDVREMLVAIALNMASRHGADILCTATGDASGRVRARAVAARIADGSLGPQEIASFTADASATVVGALAAALAHADPPGGREALLTLLSDRWTDFDEDSDAPVAYVIARRACEALATRSPFAPDEVALMSRVAESTDDKILRDRLREVVDQARS